MECGGEGWGDGAAVDSEKLVEVDDSNFPTSPTTRESRGLKLRSTIYCMHALLDLYDTTTKCIVGDWLT